MAFIFYLVFFLVLLFFVLFFLIFVFVLVLFLPALVVFAYHQIHPAFKDIILQRGENIQV